jgi:hypothetical protein
LREVRLQHLDGHTAVFTQARCQGVETRFVARD